MRFTSVSPVCSGPRPSKSWPETDGRAGWNGTAAAIACRAGGDTRQSSNVAEKEFRMTLPWQPEPLADKEKVARQADPGRGQPASVFTADGVSRSQ
jgi:hypothetical protein